MPYRLASNAVWHSLPGVVSAYQPIGAPDAIAARQNVGLWQRMLGLYTATPGVAPTWAARTGWKGTGSQWLDTAIVPTASTWSYVIRFSGIVGTQGVTFGGLTAADGYGVFIWPVRLVGGNFWWGNGDGVYSAVSFASGVAAITGKACYVNGVSTATIPAGWTANAQSLYLLAWHQTAVPQAQWPLTGNIQAFAVYSRILTPAEVWLASMQMAYCESNPEWNAWAPRRRYWIAPAAGGAVGIYGRRHELRIPGGVRIEATK